MGKNWIVFLDFYTEIGKFKAFLVEHKNLCLWLTTKDTRKLSQRIRNNNCEGKTSSEAIPFYYWSSKCTMKGLNISVREDARVLRWNTLEALNSECCLDLQVKMKCELLQKTQESDSLKNLARYPDFADWNVYLRNAKLITKQLHTTFSSSNWNAFVKELFILHC